MTKRQEELLQSYGRLTVSFPDSKTMPSGNFDYIILKKDCELFTKDKYSHQDYYELARDILERNAGLLSNSDEQFLNENSFILKKYSLSVFHKLEKVTA